MSAGPILLHPRPYAQFAGALLLLPLLPQKLPLPPLPVELWYKIFAHVLEKNPEDANNSRDAVSLALVCQNLKDIALSLLYSRVHITKFGNFCHFVRHLHTSESRWDSIRRIPYSTPGRWVQTLDLSSIVFLSRSDMLGYDSTLTQLFPLVPFLVRLKLHSSYLPSRHAIEALATSEASNHLQHLEGLGYQSDNHSSFGEDSFVRLLRVCPNLRQLEVIGQEHDALEANALLDIPDSPITPINLPHLHTLVLLSMQSSPILLALLKSPLVALRALMITFYDETQYPHAMTSTFTKIHGLKLRSLALCSPDTWPRRFHASSANLLQTSPDLRALSLEEPLPRLISPLDDAMPSHPLRTLSIPRPNAEFWRVLEQLLPRLPFFQTVIIRDVRWLREDMTPRALEAGVQGEMRVWKSRLRMRGIKLLDADWRE